ncbi:MAG: HU family DNA-binding protein [Caldimicrobium sp.]
MTKRELCEKLRLRFPDLEKKDCQFLVDNFFEILAESLKKGEKIELRGFGVFEISKARSYFFINPKNSQKYYLQGKIRALFHMGKEFKERLNTPFLAGMDLGTQTFRLILGKKFKGEILFLKSYRENVRLGEGLVDGGKITEIALKRAKEALRSFRKIMDNFGVSDYYAIGTAVFRKAENAKDVLSEIKKETGISIEVVSPEREAELTLDGILYGLKKSDHNLKNFLIVDVGGGSTEFIYMENERPIYIKSLDIGAVTLKETFNLRYPLTRGVLKSLKTYVREKLAFLPKRNFEKIVITGGTASLLGSLDLKLTKYEFNLLHGHIITRERVNKLIQKLSEMTLPRLKKIKGMEEGREDIALPGFVIYEEILDYFGENEVLLSEFGILEATLLYLSKKYN